MRPRLFASALGRLLDRDGRRVTIVEPGTELDPGARYDVAVISEGPTTAVPGAAVIRLADPDEGHPSSTVRIGSQHEIVPVSSTVDLVALIDRAGTAVREGVEA